MQWEYRTRTVKLSGGDGYNDARLKEAAQPSSNREDWWEIFAVVSLGGEEYRLFMKRAQRPR